MLAGLKDAMGGQGPRWTVAGGAGKRRISGLVPRAFDLEAVIPQSTGPAHEKSFLNYQGSLTQPPCTTGVDWWILAEPATASREELRLLRRAIFDSESMVH